MATKGKMWRPEELFPTAHTLAFVLLQHNLVTGVALTGSLARKEPAVRDIDLIVFRGTRSPFLPKWCHDPGRKGANELLLEQLVGGTLADLLTTAQRGVGVPVSYCFIEEAVLWDCYLLQCLNRRERRLKDFYKTVFREIPLLLLYPGLSRGRVRNCAKGSAQVQLQWGNAGPYEAVTIGHRCNNPGCRPRPWKEVSAEIQRRKEAGTNT